MKKPYFARTQFHERDSLVEISKDYRHQFPTPVFIQLILWSLVYR